MRPLGAPLDDSTPWNPGEIDRDPSDPNALLRQPFPHTEPFFVEPQEATLHTTAGALYLFDHGCALWDLLIMNGPCAGQIWLDRLTDSEGLRPANGENGERVGFAEHYCRWLNGSLEELAGGASGRTS